MKHQVCDCCNEQNLLAAYHRLYDALSEAVEAAERASPLGDDVLDIMAGHLGDEVRRLNALVEAEKEE